MKRALTLAALGAILLATGARADDMHMFRPDDRVVFQLAAEDWVTTKTAHVTAVVEAAVKGSEAATARADMLKTVSGLAQADWRLTSFARSEDNTGLERWSAGFEARLPENELGGLADKAKNLSKAGMQLVIGNIDFSPTLEETEAARGALRGKIYKMAEDQLAQLNDAMPGRHYRIALIDFAGGNEGAEPMPRVFHGPMNAMLASAAAPAPETQQTPVERAEQITMTARVVLAAAPDGKPPAAPLPAKH